MADLALPSKLAGMLASGKPVLVTADEGTELYDVLDGTGILVPAGNSAAMASAITLLADTGTDPALGDGRRLAKIFSHHHCLERIAIETEGRPEEPDEAEPAPVKG